MTTAHASPAPGCAWAALNRGLLVGLGPATLLWLPTSWPAHVAAQAAVLGRGVAAVMIVVAGVAVVGPHRWPRILGSLGVLLAAGGFFAEYGASPGRGFVIMLAVTAVLFRLWPVEDLRARDGRQGQSRDLDVLTAALVGLGAVAGGWFAPTLQWVGVVPLVGVQLAPIALAARAGVFSSLPGLRRWLVPTVVVISLLSPVVAVVFGDVSGAGALLLAGAAGPALIAAEAIVRRRSRQIHTPSSEQSLLDVMLLHPPRVMVASFFSLCGLATMLLALPASSTDGASMGLLDAAFTAVSATCVTGLAVKDTAVDITFFGQLVILAFIQIGGLGIMVFSAAAVVVLGRRLSVQHEAAAVDLVGATGRAGLGQAIKTIILVSLGTEAVGALLLLPAFIRDGDAPVMAAWRAVFTSISAFCNAGFALQSTSLMPYQQSPWILAVVGAIITLGGLGPPVVLGAFARRRTGLQARLVLWTSLLLVVAPFILILLFEWNASLGTLPPAHRISNALFQSVTLRTAGFNSIDFAAITPATWTVMLAVMFIGGSPGSTAGGVKTTTVAVIALAVGAILRGRERIEVGTRAVPPATVLRATAVMTAGMLSCCAAAIALQLTQQIPLDQLTFEVVSALGTVGLSMGATSQLDEVGKVIIILAMFAGRIGPLTFFMFLASRSTASSRIRRSEEQIAVG
jgi:trk system potassium uptake protein